MISCVVGQPARRPKRLAIGQKQLGSEVLNKKRMGNWFTSKRVEMVEVSELVETMAILAVMHRTLGLSMIPTAAISVIFQCKNQRSVLDGQTDRTI